MKYAISEGKGYWFTLDEKYLDENHNLKYAVKTLIVPTEGSPPLNKHPWYLLIWVIEGTVIGDTIKLVDFKFQTTFCVTQITTQDEDLEGAKYLVSENFKKAIGDFKNIYKREIALPEIKIEEVAIRIIEALIRDDNY